MVGPLGLFLAQYLGWGKRGLNYVKMRENQVGPRKLWSERQGVGAVSQRESEGVKRLRGVTPAVRSSWSDRRYIDCRHVF